MRRPGTQGVKGAHLAGAALLALVPAAGLHAGEDPPPAGAAPAGEVAQQRHTDGADRPAGVPAGPAEGPHASEPPRDHSSRAASAASASAHAQVIDRVTISATAHRSCPELTVEGRRVLDFECLSALLTSPSPGPAPPALRSARIAAQPSSALGLANPSVTRQWLGSNFGKSTVPARPAPPPPSLPPALGRH